MKRIFFSIAATLSLGFAGAPVFAQVSDVTFNLQPNPPFVNCIADGSGIAPTATATVVRGKLNDRLTLNLRHIKPGLSFDMFTVQHSNLLSDATADPNFGGSFGLAWYQSDVRANSQGVSQTQINTILLDQIFGFDADKVNNVQILVPTQTLHVGIWFNNPQDAVPCGFDATKPTPFNGEHNAGPVAMISTPNAATNLGPLCTDPDLSQNPVVCKP